MAEYIEREAVLRRMQKIATEAWKMRIKANVETVWNEAQDILRFFPAADVREVVLCRDCAVPHNKWTGCPKLNGTITGDEFFCAAGIKREES